MAKTLLKTFRLPVDVVSEIEREAESRNVSQAQYVVSILLENRTFKMKKKFDEDLEKMSQDTAYQNEQRELAEEMYM